MKEVAEKTFSAELAMSFNCVCLTPDPIPRQYTCIFLRLSGREASESSVNGLRSVVCSPVCDKNRNLSERKSKPTNNQTERGAY